MILLKLAVYGPIAAIMLFVVYLISGGFGIVAVVAMVLAKYLFDWLDGGMQ